MPLEYSEHEWFAKRDDIYEGTFTAYRDTAEEACAVADLWETMRESGVATNARCDKCGQPALVPDGLCRGHALEEAMTIIEMRYEKGYGDAIYKFEHNDGHVTHGNSSADILDALRRIVALGLTPADLEPQSEEPGNAT